MTRMEDSYLIRMKMAYMMTIGAQMVWMMIMIGVYSKMTWVTHMIFHGNHLSI